jgi:hypothetical protein
MTVLDDPKQSVLIRYELDWAKLKAEDHLLQIDILSSLATGSLCKDNNANDDNVAPEVASQTSFNPHDAVEYKHIETLLDNPDDMLRRRRSDNDSSELSNVDEDASAADTADAATTANEDSHTTNATRSP